MHFLLNLKYIGIFDYIDTVRIQAIYTRKSVFQKAYNEQ